MLGLIWGALQNIIIANALVCGGLAAGVLVALFGPQKLKDYGIGAAAVLLICFLVFNDGVSKGKADVQRRWDAAEAASLALATDAHTRAEADIPPLIVAAPEVHPGADPAPAPAKSAGTKSRSVPACKPTSRYDRCK